MCTIFYHSHYIINLFPAITGKVNLPTVAGALVALYALVWQIHTAIKNKKVVVSLGLDAKVIKHNVLVTASVTNIGTKSINPLMTNLYIMEGVPKNKGEVGFIEFPPVTEHEVNRLEGECFDCPVRVQCKEEVELLDHKATERVEFPTVTDPSFEHTIKLAYNMRLLSYHSLTHINPKETFTEETVFKIDKPGYYRIFMIYTDKAWKECICRSIAFCIENDSL